MTIGKERIAVTGMGILCSLGDTFEQVFIAMKKGRTGIGPMERFPTDKFHSGIGAEIKNYQPDAYFSTDEQQQYDLCAQYAIIAARHALQDSGLSMDDWNTDRVGAALGTCNGGIVSLEEQWTVSELDQQRTARYPFYQQGDDIAQHFQLRGPVVTLNTACAASGNAIGYAYDMIRWGYADVMLAGGSDPMSHSVYAGFNVLRSLNQQPVSPFANHFGLSLGEGAAFVVLEPLQSAVLRGATIYAEVCGYGLSNDAYHETTPEPGGKGIQVAVEMALNRAKVDPSEIGYINAHGTGTQANDQAEIAGLHGVLGEKLAEIPISSSKAYFGHNLGAAAAIELTTSLYALRHHLLPATLHYDEPRPGCEHIRIIANEMIPGKPSYILKNNSAFGGHNVSIVAKVGCTRDEMLRKQASSEPHPPRRIGIVGIGAVIGKSIGADMDPGAKANASDWFGLGKHADASSFLLKNFNPQLYERRMNRLCQFSIGAVSMALEDAGWNDTHDFHDAEGRQEIGFIYGTSRGSTESIGKFLNSVFGSGPEFASSIHFPHTVINSIAGKTAEKIKLKGFNSSLSTGGTEGMMALIYACGSIRSGVHNRFLIAAGDEFSELSDKIDLAKGITASRFRLAEGSVCLALDDLDTAMQEGKRIYAEIKGCGTAFGDLSRSITDAVEHSRLTMRQIDGVILDSVGRPGELERQLQVMQQLFTGNDVPITCVNEQYGYGESISSILPLSVASDWISKDKGMDHILTVSVSVNGNTAAAVIGRI